MSIAHNLERVRREMEAACRRAGRDPASVRLVAVSKTHPAEAVREAVAAGQLLFGENRVQEAREKIPLVPEAGVGWHLIGPLQSNKVKLALPLFRMIESVDSLALAQEIGRRMPPGERMPILVQINVGGEAQKHGLADGGGVVETLRAMAGIEGLRVRGLMTVPPYLSDPEAVRPYFRQLADWARRIAEEGIDGVEMAELSMGMSHDFAVAIEEGATLVRVGSAIFGAR